MKLSQKIFLTFIFILCLFEVVSAKVIYAKDLYVSTTGNDSVTYANNAIDNPWLTPGKAAAEALAGDIVYFRGGTYTLTSSVTTGHSGSSGSPITFRNYPGESPIITNDGVGESFFIENPYWTLDGLTLTVQNMPDHDHAIVSNGYNYDGHHLTVQNCTFHLISSIGHDNISCIRLQSNRSNYALIQNNIFRGQGTDDVETRFNHGIQFLGGGNVGTKVLNNTFYDCWAALRYKHANGDTSLSSGAEVAYNYIYSSLAGLHGNPVYVNFHDNLMVGCGIEFGDNGGGAQGNHCEVNHNTFVGSGLTFLNPGEGPITYTNITNNVFQSQVGLSIWGSGNLDPHYTTLDYNLYITGASAFREYGNTYNLSDWRAHYGGDEHSVAGISIFAGGANPSTIAGYALTSSSPGYQAASDGKSMGADISLVGVKEGNNRSTPSIPGAPGTLRVIQ